MDQLANFLGHDIRVHREFYRLPESTLQLAKVSKLLMAMEKGKLSDVKGKGLKTLKFTPMVRFSLKIQIEHMGMISLSISLP